MADLNIPIQDFAMVQGDTFRFTAFITDNLGAIINITGWSVRMQIKERDACGDEFIIELSTANGAIVLNGPLGRFDITMTALQSSALAVDKYVYDFETTDTGGVVETRFGGEFSVFSQVTS